MIVVALCRCYRSWGIRNVESADEGESVHKVISRYRGNEVRIKSSLVTVVFNLKKSASQRLF